MTSPTSMTQSAAPTLEQALEQAAAWFHDYGDSHAVKGDWAKSKRNFDREAFCLGALRLRLSADEPAAQQPKSDLVKRLREMTPIPTALEAADRIEALEAAAAQPSQREAVLVKAARELVDGSDDYPSYADLAKAVAAYKPDAKP